jgi:hypothetical protein
MHYKRMYHKYLTDIYPCLVQSGCPEMEACLVQSGCPEMEASKTHHLNVDTSSSSSDEPPSSASDSKSTNKVIVLIFYRSCNSISSTLFL